MSYDMSFANKGHVFVVMIPGVGTRHYCVECLTDAARAELRGVGAVAEAACCGHKCEPCNRRKDCGK